MKSRRSRKKIFASKSSVYFFTTCMSLILSVGLGIVYTQAAFSSLDQMNDSASMTFDISAIVNEASSEKGIGLTNKAFEPADDAAEIEISDDAVAEIAVEPAQKQDNAASSQSVPVESESVEKVVSESPSSADEQIEKDTPAEAVKQETAKAETTKVETTKAQTTKVDAPKAETTKAQTTKVETTKAETTKAQTTKVETTKAQTTKAQTTKVETTKAQTTKAQTTKAQTTKAQTTKVQTTKAQTTKAQTTKVEAPKEETSKDEVVKVEAPKTAQQIVAEEAASRGNYGRLYIKSVGVDVAVFTTSNMNRLQGIVDATDSACMFNWYDGNTMIADHNYQGFDGIKSCSVGTKAEIVTPNGTKTYTCKEIIYDGWNTGDDLTYYDFTPISTKYSSNLVIYTCNPEGTITITIWN